MAVTPGLSVTELVDNADGNESVVNEGFRRLEIFAGRAVLDRDLTAPPGSPTDGDAYIVGGSATGDWATHDNDVAWDQAGEWKFQTPFEGMELWVADEGVRVVWGGTAWVAPDSYSTTAVDTGKTWIDGKAIWRKVVDCGDLPNSTSSTTAHGVTGVSTWVRVEGVASNGTNNLSIPYAGTANPISLYTNAVNVVIITTSSWVTYQTYVVIEYTLS